MDALIESQSTRAEPPLPRSGAHLKILFAVASWGLGHATRDLPLIHRMLECGHDVTIVSSARALAVLKQELGTRCGFLEWPDLPLSLSKSAPLFYAKFTLSLPLACRAIIAENRALHRLLRGRRFDRIVSDTRFGIRSHQVASYQLTHGLRFIAPRRNALLEVAMEYIYRRCYGQVARFVVPDFEKNGLSGELSHHLRFVRPEDVAYIGILSGVRRQSVPQDVDCYVSISGPEPQRTILEKIVLRQVYDLPGRVVVSLGKPDEERQSWSRGGVTVYSYVNRCQQGDLLNRARLVVSRSGYTTMMELAELGKRALLIPTPGQTEQEYLAELHRHRGTFYSVPQTRVDLPRDLALAGDYPGYVPEHTTEDSIARFMQIVTG
ncbi:MAG TPA: glycosyltransferase [Chloroflexota bacterium]|nr:glycosyltransferase [Chloroflexota bacterium]